MPVMQVACLRLLLDYLGASYGVCVKDEHDNTPGHLAAKRGHTACLQVMLFATVLLT